jgi:triosephosphate isomerase
LTASLPVDIKEWRESTGAEYPFCTTDDITLKTIIRSNPGLLLLKGGTIINKWPNRRIPGEEALEQPLENSKWGQIPPNHSGRNIVLLSIGFIFLLSVLFLLDFRNREKKEEIEKDNSTT